jgi:hypothetical protein
MLAQRTSPTNIGVYLLSVVSARHFGWISFEEALDITPDGGFVVGYAHRSGEVIPVGFLADFGPPASTPPTLGISQSVGGLKASWPASFSTFSLEATSSLPGPANWKGIFTAPVLNGGQLFVTVVNQGESDAMHGWFINPF